MLKNVVIHYEFSKKSNALLTRFSALLTRLTYSLLTYLNYLIVLMHYLLVFVHYFLPTNERMSIEQKSYIRAFE